VNIFVKLCDTARSRSW